MKKIKLNKPPRFLTHHVLLRPDCLARMKVPAYLTQHEADRLSAFLNALVMDPVADDDHWNDDMDPDGDLNEQEIADEFPDVDDMDMPDLDDVETELDENGLPMAGTDNELS